MFLESRENMVCVINGANDDLGATPALATRCLKVISRLILQWMRDAIPPRVEVAMRDTGVTT